MIDQERVREMTKLAAMEKHEGRQYGQMVRFYRGDYVNRHLIKGLIAGSVAFGMLVGLWAACNIEQIMSELNTLQFMEVISPFLSAYVVFIVAYLICIYLYASARYAKGQESLRRYDRHLKRLCRLYEEQEERMTPNGLGETDDGIHRD